MNEDIIYTLTDEAPALATRWLFPVFRGFGKVAGIGIGIRDISVAGRIRSTCTDILLAQQQLADALAELGQLAHDPDAIIVKLPNVSAAAGQMDAAIVELQAHGFNIPAYAGNEQRYSTALGSAVNPVLRQGNSDRRTPISVKAYAKRRPHRMGAWSSSSKSKVASMSDGDFFANERSFISPKDQKLKIVFTPRGEATPTTLKEGVSVKGGHIVDATFMSVAKLKQFLAIQLAHAKSQGILFSVHLKATMMKVSDPIIFGYVVSTFFADVFSKYAVQLGEVGANPRNGLAAVLKAISKLPETTRQQIEADIALAIKNGAMLAMINSDEGTTVLHSPNDTIIDASVPRMIVNSGMMYNPNGELQDTLAVIPDRSYAGVYQAVFNDCKRHGAFDPRTMGSCANVGLMADSAEEYGSHGTTFEAPDNGTIQVLDAEGNVLLSHVVEKGDIWRMCRTSDLAVRDWVKLAVTRARASNVPTIFWLDEKRSHDFMLIGKVKTCLTQHDTSGLDIRIMSPVDATVLTLERLRTGDDTISVTGNVLRDYLTDLFPIMEVGTSSRMLSIVPLVNGGMLLETGAGGTAPNHVQQLLEEGHLRWESLGELLAMAEAFRHMHERDDNAQAGVLATTLDSAIGRLLDEGKLPSKTTGELDNRGSNFYFTLFWAQALAAQNDDAGLKAKFETLARSLSEQEANILAEIRAVQGKASDVGGYFIFDDEKVQHVMCPSPTFNAALAALTA